MPNPLTGFSQVDSIQNTEGKFSCVKNKIVLGIFNTCDSLMRAQTNIFFLNVEDMRKKIEKAGTEELRKREIAKGKSSSSANPSR